MKAKIIITILTVLIYQNASQAQRYSTIKKYPLFQEPSLKTPVIHFPNEFDAYNKLPEQSSWYLPIMESSWKYYFTDEESKIPLFASIRYADTLWGKDSNFLMNGISEKDTLMPLLLLRKVIPIPEDWYGLQVFVHFNFLASPVHLWVNGIKIGTSSTSYWGCEWNITPYLTFGRLNTILIQWQPHQLIPNKVLIGRSWIYAFPNASIRDFYIQISKDYKNKPVVEAKVNVKKFLPGIDQTFSIEFRLLDKRGNLVFPAQKARINASKDDEWISFQKKLETCNTWYTDSPYWFTAVFVLKNKNKEVVDVIKYRTGFCTRHLNESIIEINDMPYNLSSLANTNIFTLEPSYLINYSYQWLIYDLTPLKKVKYDMLSNIIEKQILTYRNYTPIAVWQISIPLKENDKNEILQIIKKLDTSRPVIFVEK